MKNNYKNLFIFIFFLLYLYIYIFFFEKKIHNSESNNFFYEQMNINEINYKGEKILKSNLFKDYLSKISDDYLADKKGERNRLNLFYNLSYYSNNLETQFELKTKFLNEISKYKNQNVSKLDIFFLSFNINFGNGLIVLNNAIFFCEIVGCHKIILYKNQIGRKWLIVNPVNIKKKNITIIQGPIVDCKSTNILCIYEITWIIYCPLVIMPQIRIHLIKSEILKNLPKVSINPDDLYIHIRGGDIFQNSPYNMYAQPPLCFYEKIINNRFFRNIYIVSVDRLNIIVNTLLAKYKNIIHNFNNIEYDISLLSNAYYIVASVSSFAYSSIKLNDNLKELWEYDIMRLAEKFLFLHHHITKFNIHYKIHTMEPSFIYRSKMFSWKGSPEQIKLMLEESCPFDFISYEPK